MNKHEKLNYCQEQYDYMTDPYYEDLEEIDEDQDDDEESKENQE